MKEFIGIGVDPGKNYFQVHAGERRLRRDDAQARPPGDAQAQALLGDHPACGSAHYWALQAMGPAKFSRTTVGILVAAVTFFPAVAPAATAADLQSQMITLLQQIVNIQQQVIAMLQTQIDQLEAQVNSFRELGPKDASNLTVAQTVANQTASMPSPTPVASKPVASRSPYPGIGPPGSCQVSSNYLITTGKYLSRTDGNLITIMEPGKNTPSSVPVTNEMFSAIGNIPPGTRLTLFSRYSAEGLPAWSSAQVLSVYCIELAP
jgi:hypothetical protein